MNEQDYAASVISALCDVVELNPLDGGHVAIMQQVVNFMLSVKLNMFQCDVSRDGFIRYALDETFSFNNVEQKFGEASYSAYTLEPMPSPTDLWHLRRIRMMGVISSRNGGVVEYLYYADSRMPGVVYHITPDTMSLFGVNPFDDWSQRLVAMTAKHFALLKNRPYETGNPSVFGVTPEDSMDLFLLRAVMLPSYQRLLDFLMGGEYQAVVGGPVLCYGIWQDWIEELNRR